MTDIDDLYEPADRDPEPCDWYPAPEPVDLEEVAELIAKRNVVHADVDEQRETERRLLDEVLPAMADELAEARERIAEWEALPTREEWVVAGGPSFPDEPTSPPVSPDPTVIAYVGRHETARLWRRMLSVHPLQEIDPKAPF